MRTIPSPTGAPYHATYPSGLGWDGENLYLANLMEADNSDSPDVIFVLDPENGAVRRRIDYPHGLTDRQILQRLAFDGQFLWAIDIYRSTRKIVPTTGANTPGYETETRSQGIAWDPGCGGMWDLVAFDETDAGTVQSQRLVLRQLPSGAEMHTITTSDQHGAWWGLAYDGCSLWTSDGPNLVRIDVSSGAELSRTPMVISNNVEGLTFDGAHLVVADTGTDQIHFIEIGPANLSTGVCTPGGTMPLCHATGLSTVDGGAAFWALDAAAPDDAASDLAGGPVVDGGAGASQPGAGCACSIGGADPAGAAAGMIAALALLLRRRRR